MSGIPRQGRQDQWVNPPKDPVVSHVYAAAYISGSPEPTGEMPSWRWERVRDLQKQRVNWAFDGAKILEVFSRMFYLLP